MSDLPIIFSGPMVRALLDGRKTQTRRVLKLPTKGEYIRPDMGGWAASTVGGKGTYLDPAKTIPAPERPCVWNQTTGTTIVPPYSPGDRLYVREAFAMDPAVRRPDRAKNVIYRADVPATEPPASDVLTMDRLMWAGAELCKWKPSIHMPRWASRITLIVTDVRVERLQDISEEDAKAEGAKQGDWPDRPDCSCDDEDCVACSHYPALCKPAFRHIWNSLHGADAWGANPWVAAYTFRPILGNIDQIGGAP